MHGLSQHGLSQHGLSTQSGKSFEEYMNEMLKQQSGMVEVQGMHCADYLQSREPYVSDAPSEFSKEDVVIARGVYAVKKLNVLTSYAAYGTSKSNAVHQSFARRVM